MIETPFFDGAQADRAKRYAVVLGSLSIIYTLFRVFDVLSTHARVKAPFTGVDRFGILAFLNARKKRTTNEIWDLIISGYDRYSRKHKAFKVPTLRRNHVVIDKDMLDEIKNLPESMVSFRRWSDEFIPPRYLGLDSESSTAHISVVRGDLTQKLGALQHLINEEAEFAFKEEVPYDEEAFQPFYTYTKILRIVARISARIFVGHPICRNEDWIRESVDFTVHMFKLQARISKWTPWAEYLFGRYTEEARIVEKSKKIAIDILKPEILRRREEEAKAEREGAKWTDRPSDTLQWIEEKKDPRYQDVTNHALAQLGLSMAAIHTSSACATFCLYEIAARPDVAAELREELKEVLAKTNGEITKATQNEMVLLDSFMKEVMRMNPLGVFGLNRIVTAKSGLTLSNGLYLPYNTQISLAVGPQHMDSTIFPSPETFDHKRFLRNNSTAKLGTVQKNAFVATSVDYLTFGVGTHACPGRFFAANEIKTMLVIFLSNYEVRLREGEKRPENFRNGEAQMPNVMAQVEVKLRPREERLIHWE